METSKYNELECKLREASKKNSELQNQCLGIEKEKNQLKTKFDKLEEEMAGLKAAQELKLLEIRAESREHKAKVDDSSNELERLREKLEIKSMQEENKKRENK